MPVSTDDYVAIADHMARYCWAVDEGDEEGWAALWTEDAEFTGVTPEPVKGREALKGVVRMSQSQGPGMMRHSVSNMMCDYIDGNRDRVQANYYNMVSHWNAGAKIALLALSKVQLVRRGEGWLIARNDSTPLMG
jgi:3-phenylpropionate/cinnamic acid dioxygenase small subunit